MLDLLYKRRSIRKFKQIAVEQEKIEQLVKAALLAPSSRNRDPQRFIIVDDKETLQKLSNSRDHGSAFLKDSPLAIVVLADSSLTDVWIEDTSIAATFIQLVVESLDLASCWIQIRGREDGASKPADEFVRQILNIPAEIEVECIIAVGYSDEQKAPHTDEKLKYEKVFLNSYGDKKFQQK